MYPYWSKKSLRKRRWWWGWFWRNHYWWRRGRRRKGIIKRSNSRNEASNWVTKVSRISEGKLWTWKGLHWIWYTKWRGYFWRSLRKGLRRGWRKIWIDWRSPKWKLIKVKFWFVNYQAEISNSQIFLFFLKPHSQYSIIFLIFPFENGDPLTLLVSLR